MGQKVSRYLGNAPDLSDFVETLARHAVRYLVIGGHAVGFHTQPRATKDLDIWFDSAPDNRARLQEAMRDYGVPNAIVEQLASARTNEIVWFGQSGFSGSLGGMALVPQLPSLVLDQHVHSP